MTPSTPPGLELHRVPAEWERHDAVWLAWPAHAELWEDRLADVQREHAALIRAIHDGGRGEAVRLLVRDAAAEASARALCGDAVATLLLAEYGDVWVRDTGCVFTVDGPMDGRHHVGALRFRFDGWGGKYRLPGDDTVSATMASASAAMETFAADFVLEGGAIDVDGQGTVLTTRQCLLHPNRGNGWTEADAERHLKDWLGAEQVIWLDEGLANDHTDGHVDTLARFVAPGIVVAMAPADGDPNAAVLEAILDTLRGAVDARGRRLRVHTIPSPGRVVGDDGDLLPASHANFYVGNTTVVVPTYGTPSGDAAVEALRPRFPGRRVVGCSARALLEGGGAFHCVTQQEPSWAAPEDP